MHGQPAEIAGRIGDLTGAARDAALRTYCGEDEALRRQVEQILDARRTFFATWAPEGEAPDAGGGEGEAEPGSTVEIDLGPRPERERIGGYRILDILGEGGMGVVFHAEQQHPLRRVALKMVHPERVTPDAKARFHREAQLLGRLLHPGIPQVYEAGEADGKLFLAMELVEGRPITTWAESKDVRARVTALMLACDAVHHAHLRGVVHQDLKPANLLVTDAGAPKVLDFGIAATLRGAGPARRRGVAGTPAYMAPEQLLGSGVIDVRADVYALGVVAYQVLTGRLPVDVPTSTLEDVREVVLKTVPALASQHDRRLRGDLDVILAKALARNAEDRYASASELGEDLRRYLAHEPILARSGGALYHAGLWVRRHPGPAAALVFVGLSVVLTVGGLVWAYVDVSDARRVAERALADARQAHDELAERHEALILLQAASELRVDPARAVDVLAGLRDERHPAAVALRYQAEAAGTPLHRLVAHQGDVRAVWLTPDGLGAWTGGYDDRLLRWSWADGTAKIQEELLHGADITLVRGRPDGAVVSAGRDGVPRLHHQGQTKELKPHGAEIDLLTFAADGGFATGDVTGKVRIWDREGELRGEVELGSAVLGGAFFGDGVAVGLEDGRVVRWGPGAPEPKVVAQFGAPAIAVSVVDGVLVAGGEDGELRFGAGPPVRGHDADLRLILGGSDGRVVTADRAGLLRIWLTDGTPLATWATDGGVVRAAAVEDSRVIAGFEDGTVKVWDLDTDLRRSLPGHGARVRDIAVGSGRILSGAGDGVARVWSLDLRPPAVLRAHGDAITHVLPHPLGWLTSSEDGTVRVWEAETGRPTTLSAHHEGVESVLLDSQGLYAGHRGGLVRGPGLAVELGGKVRRLQRASDQVLAAAMEGFQIVWFLPEGPRAVVAHQGKVEDLIVGPDGRLWSGGADGRVVRWDRPGEGVEMVRDEHPISEIATLSDGRLAIGTQDGRVILEGRVVARHAGYVQAILQLRDGPVVSLGADGSVKVEDREVGRHAGPALHALQTPDGRLWTVGGRTLARWDPATDRFQVVVTADAPIVGLAIRGPHLAFADGRDLRVVPW